MNKVRLFIASVAMTAFSLFPVIAAADIDELDVTMEVLYSMGDLEGEIIEMRGPELEGEDDFDHDEEFEFDDDEERSEDESDFDEGDEIEEDVT